MPEVRAGSKQLIREINQALVLDAVRTRGPVSRTEIAALTGMSAPTVSGISNDLIERGLVFEAETGESSGGRKPILLSLNPSAGHVVGVKVTEREAIGVVTDLGAGVVARGRQPIDGRSVDDVVSGVAQLIDHLRVDSGSSRLYGVGIGLAGVIDRDHAVVRHATYFDWRNENLAARLSSRVGLPVVLDNDINTLVANELWFRHGRDISNLLVISLGRGVGLGMVLDGEIYRGAIGGAGEFGHITVDPAGPQCPCGKHGCLEAFVGDPALDGVVGELGFGSLDEATEAALADPTSAVAAALTERAEVLGVAIANLVNVLNPDRIVLTGEGVGLISATGDAVDRVVQLHAFGSLADGLDILVQPWSDEDWARGAAAVVLGELFQPDVRRTTTEGLTLH